MKTIELNNNFREWTLIIIIIIIAILAFTSCTVSKKNNIRNDQQRFCKNRIPGKDNLQRFAC